jgi:hypothetical protein
MKVSIMCICVSLLLCVEAFSQDTTKKKNPFSISGNMGVTYEGYGLNVNPSGSGIYSPRRPWNQLRFQFQPTMKWGKNFTLPFNINIAAIPTNFAGPFSGFVSGGPGQTIGQWLMNPMNNIGLNPKYKWAELQLGTQYLKYSDLSTGDIGVFGAGFDLRPGDFLIKFFTGTSQPGIDYIPPPGSPPGITGAYKRTHWMFQLGKEKEGKYKTAFTFAKGIDKVNSVTSPPLTTLPQESFVLSFLLDKYFNKGWYFKTELAQGFYTADVNAPLSPTSLSFKPFIDARTSTIRDFAAEGSIGKKSTSYDIGAAVKYIGAGFKTTGYPFMQPDHLDYTVNTRFSAWQNKMNVIASVGGRKNNLSNTTLASDQFIANINWFTQFTNQFNVNINYNNFGFQAGSSTSIFGVKNVSNDLSINPTYTWTTKTMNHLLSLNYSYSKYKERLLVAPFTITDNNTHTAILTYVPVYFNKEITPDFSVMYFNNTIPTVKNKLFTISSSLGMPMAKKKVQLRGQLQYTLGKINTFTANNNFIASCNIDCKLNKKLSWNNFLSTNYFKYGNELGSLPLVGANYLESNIRTGLQYKF